MEWFAGQSAIVTGAAHGIGRAIAELLEQLGAHVIVLDKDDRALAEVFDDGRYVRWHADLATGGTEELADEIWRAHGPIELLVNNAGVDLPADFLALDEAEFDLVFDTNLRGPWFLTKRIAQHLVDERVTGAILFVSSLHDTFVSTRPHYSASKAAISMLVKELAGQLAPHGVRVNAVSPGSIRARHNPVDTPAQEEQIRRMVPLGRVGEPADVARMAAVLLSDEWSGYVTGANVRVDGGLGLHSWAAGSAADSPASGREGLRRRARRRAR